MLGFTFALEVELDVVEGGTNFLERGFWVEIGITAIEQGTDVTQAPPSGWLIVLGPTEGLANHFYQVVQFLEGFVLLYQRGYLAVVQPETLTAIK